jgi:hypothetical protein
VNGLNLFAAVYWKGVFLSTNNGTSWIAVNSGLPENSTINSLVVVGSNIYAGTEGHSCFVASVNQFSGIGK